jgi:hypothetical protein
MGGGSGSSACLRRRHSAATSSDDLGFVVVTHPFRPLIGQRLNGSCALTVTAAWANLDTGASGSSDITAVSTIDGHYGFIGNANTTFETGSGTVVVTLSSHPGAELRITA